MKFKITTIAVLAVALVAECSRHEDAKGDETQARAGELIGVLKLVRQEYQNAVTPAGGAVIDATEYAETELFAEQAQAKLAQLDHAGVLPSAHAGAMRDGIARVREQVGAKAAPAEVGREASAAIALVEELLAGAVPAQVRGTVLATTRADQAIGAEAIVDEYRIGVSSGPARSIFRREGATLAPEQPVAGEVYVAALVRERRTKRFLPAQTVTLTITAGDMRVGARLAELWGDYHQYGANVGLPASEGPVTVTITVSPPAYARHGDMLTHFVAPATATLAAHVRAGALLFDAKPVQPVDADYSVGDDVLQAVAEAGTLHDAGPYRIGVIVEGPEPFWVWQDGKPVLQAVGADATNHVEVVLLDRDNGQLVPDAAVRLTFLAGTREVGSAHLHPLLSVFSHYGETLALSPDATTVRVHVDPPALGSIDKPRLEAGTEIELPIPKRRSGA